MTIADPYFDVHTVARYLYGLKPNISPLKLQKSLYFLFAYHGALYTKDIEEGQFEGTIGSKKPLFNAEFEAWQYGPVIREVYFKDRDNEYREPEGIQQASAEIESEPEVKKFIDELFGQIDEFSDFKLVDRSHQDKSWMKAYNKGQSTVMSNESIIEEYLGNYV